MRQLQVIQHMFDRVEAKVVMDRPLSAGEHERFVETIESTLRLPHQIDGTIVTKIRRAVNGKFQEYTFSCSENRAHGASWLTGSMN